MNISKIISVSILMAIGVLVTELAMADTTERVNTDGGFKIIIKDDNGNVIRIKNWTSHKEPSGMDYPTLDNVKEISYTSVKNNDGTIVKNNAGTTRYRKTWEKETEYYNDRSGKVAKEAWNIYEPNEKLGGHTIRRYDTDHHLLIDDTEYWNYDHDGRVKTHERFVDRKRVSGEIYYYDGKNHTPYFISGADWDNLYGLWRERKDEHQRRLKWEEKMKSADADKKPQGDEKVGENDEHGQTPKTEEKMKSTDADKKLQGEKKVGEKDDHEPRLKTEEKMKSSDAGYKPQGDEKVGEVDKSKMTDTDKEAPRREFRSRDMDNGSIFKNGRTSRGRHR